MVTERNDIGSESQVETADVSVNIESTQVEDISPAIESPQDLPVPEEPSIEVAPEIEPQAEPQNTEQTATTQGGQEFRKYQSATDKRMAEIESENKQLREHAQLAEQQASLGNLDIQVQQFQQRYVEELVSDDIPAERAELIARQQADTLRRNYLDNLELKRLKQEQIQQQQDDQGRIRAAAAYELASQYQIPFTELQDFPDRNGMEKHAKALYRVNKLEKSLQQATPSQQLSGTTPGADVAPTDSGDVIDRYNAGDPAVTTEMARSAAQRLGLTSLFN